MSRTFALPTLTRALRSSSATSSRACRRCLGSTALRRNGTLPPSASRTNSTPTPAPSASAASPTAQTLSTTKPRHGGPLAKVIRDSIKATGPLSISRYMQFCLSHPVHGYYAQGDVFGRKGDFITSPEISQIFGELVAIWLLTRYMAAGSPEKCRLIELGPGRGTLMEDVLRTLSTFPGIKDAIKRVHLVDNSEKMRAIQSEKLGKRCAELGIELTWNDQFDDVHPSDEYTMFIAHEFFDAMPINLFERTSDGFREVCVDADPAFDPSLPTSASSSGLRLALSREASTLSAVLPTTSPRFKDIPVGARVEIAQDSFKIMRKVGEIIGSPDGKGGAGLIIDYGAAKTFDSSFRAFKQHKIVDVFEEPGTADLTANVDFEYLKESLAGSGTTSLGPIPQSMFLLRLGLEARLRKLMDTASTPERKDDIRKGATRLIDPMGMGSQYQVMGISTTPEGEEVYPFPTFALPELDMEKGKGDENKSGGEEKKPSELPPL